MGDAVIARRHDAVDWLLLATLVAMWGTSFLFIEVGIRALPPASLVAMRILVAAAILLPVARALGVGLPCDARRWVWFAILALVGNCIPFFLITWGQRSIDSGMTGILVGFMPIATLLLAHRFVPGERITRAKAAGFTLAFAGLAVLLGPEAAKQWRGTGSEVAGQLACLAGALCYAANSVLAKRMPPSDALAVATWTTTIAAVVMLTLALAIDGLPPRLPDPGPLSAALWLGVGPTALATLVYYRLIARAGPTFMSLVNYASPPIAVAAGVLLLDEPLELGLLLALSLVLGGIAVATRRPR